MIHIDSTNRNTDQFILNTDFEIPVNQIDNRQRTNIIVNSDIQVCFEWIGNSENNNPISKINNDTFLTNIIPISLNKCIIVPANQYISDKIYKKDYFVGTKLWFNYNNKMGTIIEYNHETCTVTIDSNVFQYFFENIDYEDYKDKNLSEFYREAYIVNMSFHKGNNIVLLGNTLDLNSEYIVENVTNRWRSKLKQFESNYFIEDLGSLSYSLLDTYIVYRDEPKQSRLYSIKFANSASNTIDVTDSILYLTTTDYIVLIVDKYTHEKRYYKIENINGNQITISNTNALSMKNHVIALLPIENNFSTLTIDKNEYEKKVLLRLLYLSLPNQILKSNHSNLQLKSIPYIILKINKELTIDKLSSNVPNVKSSFICFSSNQTKGNYVEFKSGQILELQQIFEKNVELSIFLPNNEEILSFTNSDILSMMDQDKKILIYDTKNIVSMFFQLQEIEE